MKKCTVYMYVQCMYICMCFCHSEVFWVLWIHTCICENPHFFSCRYAPWVLQAAASATQAVQVCESCLTSHTRSIITTRTCMMYTRACRPFEELITSWLRTALHFNPNMRGRRPTATQDAPCLVNMDHILQTKASCQLGNVWTTVHLYLHIHVLHKWRM